MSDLFTNLNDFPFTQTTEEEKIPPNVGNLYALNFPIPVLPGTSSLVFPFSEALLSVVCDL